MVYLEIFNAVSSIAAQNKAQQDFDDLQNEVAGRETGRIRRFMTGEQHDPKAIRKRRDERETTLFLSLMQNAEYARLYQETGKELKDTRRLLDDARDKLAAIRAQAEAEQADILSRAARTKDGQLIFRGDDDRAYTRDGILFDDPELQNIIWQPGQARLDEIQSSDGKINRIDETARKFDNYDIDLGDMTERYEDTENPISADDLEAMQDGLSDIQEGIEQNLQKFAKLSDPNDAPAKAPKMDAYFPAGKITGLDSL